MRYFNEADKKPIGRIEYIDFMKGVAVILVIVFHAIDFNYVVNNILISFHNSSFFLASGFLFYYTLISEKKHIFRVKFVRLIYPFIIWSMIYMLVEVLFLHYEIENYSKFFSVIWEIINRIWFFPTLFLAFLTTAIIIKAQVSFKFVLPVYIVLLFVMSIYAKSLSKIVFCSFLVYIGTQIVNVTISDKMLLILLGIYLIVCCCGFSGGGIIYYSCYGGFWSYAFSTVGCLLIFGICQTICKKEKFILRSIFIFMGINSIHFYVLHVFILFIMNWKTEESIVKGGVHFFVCILLTYIYLKTVKNTLVDKILFGFKLDKKIKFDE